MPSTASDTIMISGTSASRQGPASTRILPSLSPLPSLAITICFLVAPKPFPHPSSVSCRPALLLLPLFHFGTSTSHAPSSPTARLLLSQCVLSYTPEPTTDRILEIVLSFAQHLYFQIYVLASSFQIDLDFPLRLISGPASDTYFLFLPKYFKNLFATFTSRQLGHLLNGNTELQRHLHSFLQFSDNHFHIITITRYLSAFPWPSFRRQPFAFACLPSRPSGLLLLLPTTSFAEAGASAKCCRGTAGLLPWLLDI